MRRISFSRAGQSLIEVSFATGVVSLVLVAILSSVIQSVRNSRVALEQTRTTNYAQEVLEWARSQRDSIGWGVFYSSVSTRQGAEASLVYCVPTLPVSFAALVAASSGPCQTDEVIAGTAFQRQIVFSVQSAEQILVTAQVIRPGESGPVTTSLDVLFSDYE